MRVVRGRECDARTAHGSPGSSPVCPCKRWSGDTKESHAGKRWKASAGQGFLGRAMGFPFPLLQSIELLSPSFLRPESFQRIAADQLIPDYCKVN